MPRRTPTLLTLALCLGLTGVAGCQRLIQDRDAASLPPARGLQPLTGLADTVSVRRNALGMPLIESRNFHDALFAMGYVHASDRIAQMLSLRLAAEGRLAEMAGPGVLEIDRFMRALNLRESARQLHASASPRMQRFLEVYSRGVNAWLYRYRDKLPTEVAASGYRPEYWKPEDSVLLFCLLNFGLSVNLQEEVAALLLAEKVGADRLAWLLPGYPDEPLPFDEAAKLAGLDLAGQVPGLAALAGEVRQLAGLGFQAHAASNNWALDGGLTRSGKPILANDAHLPLSMPSQWTFVQLRAPQYQAAGVSIAGIPAVVAGFNGKLGWGMTMVMGDNQDLFLEKLRRQGGRLEYLADGRWLPVRERYETFFVKGGRPQREVLYETRNGVLLNNVLGERKQGLQPLPLSSAYGLALRHIDYSGDRTLDAFFDLSRAGSVNDAFEAAREIRATALNLLFADARDIGWQVTGRYPNRREGLGLVPSPGWEGRYDWDGFAEPMLHPYDQNPPQGWLGTANHRVAPRGYGMQLSSSWYYPERYERLAELAARGQHDTRSTIAMQYDQTSLFVSKLKAMFVDPGMAQPLAEAIGRLPPAERARAEEALGRLMAFDGRLASDSADAAIHAAFLQESMRALFEDELGRDSPAWRALVQTARGAYSAPADHLLGRVDSPFWDDTRTPQVEDKPAILARSLAAAIASMETALGPDRRQWQWGALHRYHWASGTTQLAPYLGASQQAAAQALRGYLDRGPYPAGGDHTTLNAAAYDWGGGYDAWLVPSMRLIVDFGLDEPLLGLNSSGQSGNPASPHYADGIDAWRNGRYQSFPFRAENLDKAYGSQRLLLTPEKAR